MQSAAKNVASRNNAARASADTRAGSGEDQEFLPVLGAGLHARRHVVFIDHVAVLAIHTIVLRMDNAHQGHVGILGMAHGAIGGNGVDHHSDIRMAFDLGR